MSTDERTSPRIDHADGAPTAVERGGRALSSDTSVPAIVATIALVIFAVFIGVYGPRIGNRQQLPGGTTLLELASALGGKHANESVAALQLFRDEPKGREAVEDDLRTILGRDCPLPSLEGDRISWLRATRIRVPGATGAQVFLRVGAKAESDYASLFILDDEDRFTVFDPFGRPLAMPEGEVFSVGLPGETPASVMHIFRAGGTVYGVYAARRETTDALVAATQSALAGRTRP